jgi:NAD(P)H-dependent FMN reductase
MTKIGSFTGSNSSTSINKKLVLYTATLFDQQPVAYLALTDYKLPIYSEDLEREQGFSDTLKNLKNKIAQYDALLISVNEHNGSISAFFKNTLDWLSRLEYKFLQDKKVLLLSTSPGGRGAASALAYAKDILPRYGADIVESFSLPAFQDNFSTEKNTITNPTLEKELLDKITAFKQSL